MSISAFLEKELLDHVLRNETYSPPATVYMSLHTGDPGGTGANEVAGGSYARQASTWNVASGVPAVSTLAANVDFAGMPAATVTHIGLWDAVSSGNALWDGAASASKTYGAGDTARVSQTTTTVTLD